MRRPALAISLSTALVLSAVPADAAVRVRWEATRCDEVTLAAPANPTGAGLPPGTAALTIVVYRCDRGVVGDSIVSPFVVSEIGAVTPGGIVLLRQVSNSVDLFKGLRRLGVPSFYSSGAHLDIVEDPAGTAEATIPIGQRRYTLTAAAVPDPAGTPSSFLNGPGATYRSSGRKGDVTVSYDNRFDDARDGPGAAAGTVDASEDPELAAWLGSSLSGGAGIYVRGSWTGTAAPTAT